MTTDSEIRVFLSYSHDDKNLFQVLKAFLEDKKLCVLCDRDISVGTPFTDAIKGLISHAHVFMPLITASAQKRPWVHQETGYAMAKSIPILPLVTTSADIPQAMVAQLQAIPVPDDLSNLEELLTVEHVRSLVVPQSPSPQDMVQVADWPEERASRLAECANRVRQLGHYARLRQCGAFSSFCLPDNDIQHVVWQKRDGNNVRGDYLHLCQRAERQALERHVAQAGCRLIIWPHIDLSKRGPDVRRVRLETLRQFLETMPPDKCQVVVSQRARDGNVTILGDWFVAESLVPKAQGYRQTVFNWHAPTALRAAIEFDQTFDEICAERGMTASEATQDARADIERLIEQDSRSVQVSTCRSAAGDTQPTQPRSSKRIKAVVFDFDGVFVDTERLKTLSYYRALSDPRGPYAGKVAVAEEDYIGMHPVGKGRREVCEWILTQFGLHDEASRRMESIEQCIGNADPALPQTPAALLASIRDGYDPKGRLAPWKAIAFDRAVGYEETKNTAPAIPQTLAFLQNVCDAGLAAGLVTRTGREATLAHLRRIGLGPDAFAAIVCEGDAEVAGQGKDRFYEVACDRLGVAPPEAMAVEDTDAGVAAAHLAGMALIVAAPTSMTRKQAFLGRGAHLVVQDLSMLTAQALACLGMWSGK